MDDEDCVEMSEWMWKWFRKHEVSPRAPLEQSSLSYSLGGWADPCQERAGNPT